MNPAAIIDQLMADGVSLTLTAAGRAADTRIGESRKSVLCSNLPIPYFFQPQSDRGWQSIVLDNGQRLVCRNTPR